MSLSNYLLGEIKEIAEMPALSEMRERLHQRESFSPSPDTDLACKQANDEKVRRDQERLLDALDRFKISIGKRKWKREDLYVREHNHERS
jgi:hypothetical protein